MPRIKSQERLTIHGERERERESPEWP